MKGMGQPLHLIYLLAELYRIQNEKVKATGTFSEKFHIRRGVQQG